MIDNKTKVKISFSMESVSTLWNVIFEGFDQEVVLVTKFYGEGSKTIGILQNFAVIIQNRFKDCVIDIVDNGIVIRKPLPRNNQILVNKWENLMIDLRDNISEMS